MIRAAGNESAGPAIADFAVTQQETTPIAYTISGLFLCSNFGRVWNEKLFHLASFSVGASPGSMRADS